MVDRPAAGARVIGVRGSVIDVAFPEGDPPAINEALEIGWDRPWRLTAEVQSHLDLVSVRAVALQNVRLVLVPRGVAVWSAAGWSVFSSLPQPALAVPAFIFVTMFEPLLPLGLGLAAGAMIWMAFAELLPDALSHADAAVVANTVVISAGVMLAFQQFLKS